jgi:hypothetical protein
MAVLRAAGIRDLRISIGWDSVEPLPGEYQWEFWDRFIAVAVAEYGITLLPYIAYTPRWNASGDPVGFWHQPPRDYAAFGEFMRALVARYKDRIHSWEIWNEPDNPAYWSGTAAQFAPLLRAGATGVRAADPTATVVFGGIAWNVEFVHDLFAEYGAAAAVDVVNMHSYAETWSADPLESVPPYIQRVAAVVRQYGDGEALWMAEMGYSSYRAAARVSDDYAATFAYEHTAGFQAVALVRMLILALATDRLDLIAWYDLHDMAPDAEVIGDINNRHLGVLDLSGRPKPALAALAFMRALFGPAVRPIDRQLTITRAPGSVGEVHAFQRADGAAIIAAWLRTNPPPFADRTADGAAIDGRVERIGVSLPNVRGSQLVLYDPSGVERRRAPLVRDGSRAAVELDVHGGDVVLGVVWP